MNIQEVISKQIKSVVELIDKREISIGNEIFNNSLCQVLSQSANCFELIVSEEDRKLSVEYILYIEPNGNIFPASEGKLDGWDRNSYACLLQIENDLKLTDPKEHLMHKKYTREGMRNRVMKERQLKADKANYKIKWADNIINATNPCLAISYLYREPVLVKVSKRDPSFCKKQIPAK